MRLANTIEGLSREKSNFGTKQQAYKQTKPQAKSTFFWSYLTRTYKTCNLELKLKEWDDNVGLYDMNDFQFVQNKENRVCSSRLCSALLSPRGFVRRKKTNVHTDWINLKPFVQANKLKKETTVGNPPGGATNRDRTRLVLTITLFEMCFFTLFSLCVRQLSAQRRRSNKYFSSISRLERKNVVQKMVIFLGPFQTTFLPTNHGTNRQILTLRHSSIQYLQNKQRNGHKETNLRPGFT